MRVICPKCQDAFNAKINARRIKCPSCGFREDAPEGGFAEAFASGKKRPGLFAPAAPRPNANASSRRLLVVGAILLVAVAAAAVWAMTQTGDDTPAGPTFVAVETGKGTFVLELYDDKAPVTVANFKAYVAEGFYSNLTFHRVVQQGIHVIQGGGTQVDGNERATTHPAIVNEAVSSGLKNEAYTISMARLGPACQGCPDQPDSATSQFFINTQANPSLDPGGSSEAGYAVFGKVVQGREVVDDIQDDPVNGDRPQQPVVIRSMKIVPAPVNGTTPPVQTTSSSAPPPPPGDCPDVPNNIPPPMDGPAQTDLITPGVWNVCGNTEYNFVWVHNNGVTELPYTFSVTGPEGTALPAGWNVTFARASGTLMTSASRSGSGPGGNYPDWAGTVATLTLPADFPAGPVAAELHAAGVTRPFTFYLQEDRGRVGQLGDSVRTHYDLHRGNGEAVQEGDFCHRLGGQGAVTGYAMGVAGVAKGETITLVVPPPFAYGYGEGDLANDTLLWTTTLTEYVTAC